MRKSFKICLIIIFILLVLGVAILITLEFKPSSNPKISKDIDKIANYNYHLQKRDTTLMQETFKSLKNLLSKKDIDYDLYATYLSELFIIDLFTMDNKNNKYDVGGLEYVLPEIADNYRLNVEDTLYKYLIETSKRTSNERYPVVKSINQESLENTQYTYQEVLYDAYKIILNWEYEENLGYQTKAEIILIKKDKQLYIVSYKGVEEKVDTED